MFRVGPASLAVAVVGVAVPFGLGYAYWAYLPHPASGAGDLTTAAIFVGATLTATSVGITARVLSDLGRMATPEARIIIGAAVIDDVLGLVILSVVSGVAAGASVTVLGILEHAGGGGRVPGRRRARSDASSCRGCSIVVGADAGALRAPGVRDRLRAGPRRRWRRWPGRRSSSGPSPPASSSRAPTSSTPSSTRSGRSASIFTPIFFVSVGASVNLRLLDPTSPSGARHAGRRRRAHRHRHRRQGRGRLGGALGCPCGGSSSASAWCPAARSGSSSPTSAAARACCRTRCSAPCC